MTLVSLDAIKTDRSLLSDNDLKRLAASMKKNYLPILVLPDMTLVDGLRRIEAARSLGWTEIDAFISDDIPEIQDILYNAHESMPSPRRIYEIHQIIRDLIAEHHLALRNSGQWRMEKRPEGAKRLITVQVVRDALHIPYTAYVGRMSRIYNNALKGDPFAMELVELMDSGELAGATASSRYEEAKQPNRVALPAPQQANALTESIRALTMVAKVINGINRDQIKVSHDELMALVEQLRFQRSEVYSAITRLARRAGKQNG